MDDHGHGLFKISDREKAKVEKAKVEKAVFSCKFLTKFPLKELS